MSPDPSQGAVQAVAEYGRREVRNIRKAMGDPRHANKLREATAAFKGAYRALADLHFKTVVSETEEELHVLVAKSPREKIPKVEDLKFNPSTMELKLGPSAQVIQAGNKSPNAAATAASKEPVPAWRVALANTGMISDTSENLSGFGSKGKK